MKATSIALALLSFLVVAACTEDPAAPTDDEPEPAPMSPGTDEPGGDPTIGAAPSGDTVELVAVPRYVGTWFEIARIAQGFQRDCAATTATYTPIDATAVKVRNECRRGGLDGELLAIDGTARIVDPATNARLEVDFGFARSPYWIVDLGVAVESEPYPWAIVSNPDRSALWILSRTATMPPARYDALIARLTARGFRPERLERTLQPMP